MGRHAHYDYQPANSQHLECCDSPDVCSCEPFSDNEDRGSDWDGTEQQLELSSGSLAALTCPTGGLQTVWLTLFSHGSSYLASLGISELHTSLIWTATPVCGTIVAPLVGVLSDSAHTSWGRRRPFIFFGAMTIIIAINALAWIEYITAALCSIHGGTPSMAAVVQKYWAVFWVTILNIGIQCLQLTSRALTVDVCPAQQQSLASAWAGRFMGFGNILGYILGSVPLPFLTGERREAGRFRCMAVFAGAILVVTVAATVYFIEEDDHADDEEEGEEEEQRDEESKPWLLISMYHSVIHALQTMPSRARRTCTVQFFSAMAWFGFLFYNTRYVSALFLAEFGKDRGSIREDGGVEEIHHSAAHKAKGMRLATTASLLFATVALITNIALPYLNGCLSIHDDKPHTGKKYLVSRLLYPFRHIHILWAAALAFYSLLTWSTLLISTPTGGISIIALAGLASAITQWAPLALLGEALSSTSPSTTASSPPPYHHRQASQLSSTDLEKAPSQTEIHTPTSETPNYQRSTGAMLGVHSASVCIPQILAAVVCSFIFWLAGRMGIKGGEEGAAVGWVLRASGVAGGIAAWVAWMLGS